MKKTIKDGEHPAHMGRSWKMSPCDQYEGIKPTVSYNPGLGVAAASIRSQQTSMQMNKSRNFVRSQFPQRKGGGY